MDKQQREQWVSQNLGLVHLCIKRFKSRGIDYDDLYSAGCVGLLKAIDGFDASRGLQFSTYAVPVILGEVKRLFRDGGALKVSRTLRELSLKVARAKQNFCNQYDREPTISELATQLSVNETDIVEAIQAGTPPMSLTQHNDQGEEHQLDVPVDTHEEKIAELLSLHGVIQSLAPQDQLLICHRYLRGKTQTETAKQLGMTQVQVSRREKKILLMLREKLLE